MSFLGAFFFGGLIGGSVMALATFGADALFAWLDSRRLRKEHR